MVLFYLRHPGLVEEDLDPELVHAVELRELLPVVLVGFEEEGPHPLVGLEYRRRT